MDNTYAQNYFDSINSILIKPEVERRILDKTLPKEFIIKSVLIILSIDSKPVIQFNDEVEATCEAKLKDGVIKNKGDSVYINEIDGIKSVLLPEKYENCAYIYLLALEGGFSSVFDFRYNKGIRKQQLKTANDFLNASEIALSGDKYSVFIDTLFSATEILIKLFLLRQPDKEFIKKTNHNAIKFRINSFSKYNEFTRDITNLYNKLHVLRSDARYGTTEFKIGKDKALEMLVIVKDFNDHISKEFA